VWIEWIAWGSDPFATSRHWFHPALRTRARAFWLYRPNSASDLTSDVSGSVWNQKTENKSRCEKVETETHVPLVPRKEGYVLTCVITSSREYKLRNDNVSTIVYTCTTTTFSTHCDGRRRIVIIQLVAHVAINAPSLPRMTSCWFSKMIWIILLAFGAVCHGKYKLVPITFFFFFLIEQNLSEFFTLRIAVRCYQKSDADLFRVVLSKLRQNNFNQIYFSITMRDMKQSELQFNE